MGTDHLFVQPSLFRGAARIVDFWGDLTVYNVSPTPEAADALALFSDFSVVGCDLEHARAAFAAPKGQLALFPESEGAAAASQ